MRGTGQRPRALPIREVTRGLIPPVRASTATVRSGSVGLRSTQPQAPPPTLRGAPLSLAGGAGDRGRRNPLRKVRPQNKPGRRSLLLFESVDPGSAQWSWICTERVRYVPASSPHPEARAVKRSGRKEMEERRAVGDEDQRGADGQPDGPAVQESRRFIGAGDGVGKPQHGGRGLA